MSEILKPRDRDGKPLTEAEILALTGRELDWHAHFCIIENDPLLRLSQNRECVYHCSTDIGHAFKVDRPDWRWEMEDYDRGNFDVTVYAFANKSDNVDNVETKYGTFSQRLDRKPTPADYARARCIAALLLTLKIGE